MTIKLDLSDETEAGLSVLARAQGLSLEAYAEKVLCERSATARPPSISAAAQKAQAFRDFARSHRPVGSLSDESLRRENLVREAQ